GHQLLIPQALLPLRAKSWRARAALAGAAGWCRTIAHGHVADAGSAAGARRPPLLLGLPLGGPRPGEGVAVLGRPLHGVLVDRAGVDGLALVGAELKLDLVACDLAGHIHLAEEPLVLARDLVPVLLEREDRLAGVAAEIDFC